MLNGIKVAILVAAGFEQAELAEPKKASMRPAPRRTSFHPPRGRFKHGNTSTRRTSFRSDVPLDKADAESFDALLLPGGVANPDQLRTLPQAAAFVRSFFRYRKASRRDLSWPMDAR